MIVPVPSTVAAKDVLAYLFKNMLELHSDNIAALKNRGSLWNYKNLNATSIESIERLYKSKHISQASFNTFPTGTYLHNKPYITYEDIMLMSDKILELIDSPLLRLKYSLLQTSVLHIKPIVTAATVLPFQIEVTFFVEILHSYIAW